MLGSVRGVVSNDHSYRDKANPRVPTLFRARKATRFRTHHRKVRTARRGRRTWHVQKLLGREPGDPTSGQLRCPLWPASGRRGAVADDERTWEVRLRNSSCEQSRATGCGVGGAKGGGRGECEPAKHALSVRPRSFSRRRSFGGIAQGSKPSGAGNPESGQGARRSIVACVISFNG